MIAGFKARWERSPPRLGQDRLKSSKLPEQAAQAEQKHREDLEAETQKALEKNEKNRLKDKARNR